MLSNQPLVIVDGVEFNSSVSNMGSDFWNGISATSRLNDIDPNTIEKIQVLKGLSQTMIYGEKGRNGVILITTKNGSDSALD
jgi:TonB-dependent SusC/RagA subfamily outer membrane receptor